MKQQNTNNMKMMSYKKFSVMMLISFLIMYLAMFLNVDDVSHIYISLNRTYMALLMVSPMAIVMMLMMGSMYPNKKTNSLIVGGGAIVFVLAFIFLRNQTFISDVQYMKGMIPHHSSAIMTSKHAAIKDPEVKALSDSIIKSQEEEITEMKAAIKRLK